MKGKLKRVLTLTHHMGEGEERSRSTIRVLTLTHHMGEGEGKKSRDLTLFPMDKTFPNEASICHITYIKTNSRVLSLGTRART